MKRKRNATDTFNNFDDDIATLNSGLLKFNQSKISQTTKQLETLSHTTKSENKLFKTVKKLSGR